jgi:hypothetical protein
MMHRRKFLGRVAGGLGGVVAGLGAFGRPGLARALESQERRVLVINMHGGLSQLESWDPKPGTQFGGPFRAISTSVPGIQISELLPKTAQQMHHLALVRSLCTKDNSHSAGVARIQRGDPKNRGVTYPFFGSAVAKLLGAGTSGLPPYVWIKPGNGGFIYADAGFLGAKFGALALGDGKPPENLLRSPAVSAEDDDFRNEFRRRTDRRYAERRRGGAVEANSFVYDVAQELMKREALFDETQYSPRDVERYGSHELGRHMLKARKLLEAGVTFVKVNTYGWDTHGDNFVGHANLVPKFDQAFAAVIEDLAAGGLLEHVLVIAISEFGRTPRINGHVGRDHWPEAWSAAMAGCGVRKGIAVGGTNDKGTWVAGEEFDIGHMFHTWFRALGVDPRQTEYENNGQPLPIAHEDCRAVEELLA